MKRILPLVIVFSGILNNLNAQEVSQKKIIYGVQMQLTSASKFPLWRNIFSTKYRVFSFPLGVVGRYQFSDTSKIKLEFGLLYVNRTIADSRGNRCDQAPCPQITLNYHYLEFPFLLQYNILKSHNRMVQPFVNVGLVPALLTFGTKKHYTSGKSGDIDQVTDIEHYSMFKGYNKSFKPPINLGLVVGGGTDVKVNKLIINIEIRANFGMIQIDDYGRYNALIIALSVFKN